MIRRKLLLLLVLLGLSVFVLPLEARPPRCECAPLGGDFCGSDGRIYDSPCMAACFGATIVPCP